MNKYSLFFCFSLMFKIALVFLVAKDSNYIAMLVAETLLLYMLIIFSPKKIFYLLLIPCVIINAMQLSNAFVTGNYIVPVTILNIEFVNSIGKTIIPVTIIIIIQIFSFIFDIFFAHGIRNKYSQKKQYILFLFFVIFFLSPECMSRNYPIHNFYNTASTVYRIFTYKNGKDVKIPYVKNEIKYNSSSYGISLEKEKKYNIIVLFLEGTSYRVFSEKLTKNFYDLKNNSINTINYFNHTLPTFRGIRSQLISGYQIGAVPRVKKDEKRVISLPDILNENGYTTAFVSPHRLVNFNQWIKDIGFKKLYASSKDDLNDKDMFRRIYVISKELEKIGSPFFVCAYIFGPHAGFEDTEIKYEDGKNSDLNKFHNMDHWFGEFFQKFKNDSLYKNTVLIVTSDHGSVATHDFIKAFQDTNLDTSNPDNLHGIDHIPLIIHYNGVEHIEIDGKYRNSLSFAPTVLDLFNIPSHKNYFLGNSIFLQQDDSPFSHISNIDFYFYHIEQKGVFEVTEDDPVYRETIKQIMDFCYFAE